MILRYNEYYLGMVGANSPEEAVSKFRSLVTHINYKPVDGMEVWAIEHSYGIWHGVAKLHDTEDAEPSALVGA